MTRRQGTAVAILLVTVAAVAAGCGKRGRLEAPEGSTYPQAYPAPETMVPSDSSDSQENDAEHSE